MNLGDGLFFIYCKSRDIPMLPVKLIYLPCWLIVRPGCKSLFSDGAFADIVCLFKVKTLQTFSPCIYYGSHTMVRVHCAIVAGNHRESRHPWVFHVIGHTKV